MVEAKVRDMPAGYRVAARYRLEHSIGEGGMASVFAAWDERGARQVAIKLLLANHASNPRIAERFEREARAAASIRHPGVVEIFDRGSDAGALYLVMELLQGESLQALLERTRVRPPLSFVMRVIGELCSALSAAHERGVVHRDLKPSNIFLARASDGAEQVKVLDFGIAKLRDDRLTNSGEVFGTLAYMPPELLHGAAGAVPASDLYAVGTILFELITGQRPFEAVGPGPLAIAILTNPTPKLRQFRPDAPQALADVVERALCKDPAQRFASARELHDALSEVAFVEPGSLAVPSQFTGEPTQLEPAWSAAAGDE